VAVEDGNHQAALLRTAQQLAALLSRQASRARGFRVVFGAGLRLNFQNRGDIGERHGRRQQPLGNIFQDLPPQDAPEHQGLHIIFPKLL
jgi:hypothetical protein